MAKFCTKCGKPLKDGKPCDCEKNKKEEVNTNNIGENIINILKEIFVTPFDTIKKYSNTNNIKLAFILSGISALVFGLFTYLFMDSLNKGLTEDINELSNALGGSLYSVSNVPFFEPFIIGVITMIAFLFALCLMSRLFMSTVFKSEKRFRDYLSLYGNATSITILTMILACIGCFISYKVGIVIALIGTILYFVSTTQTLLKHYEINKERIPYSLALTITTTYIITFIVLVIAVSTVIANQTSTMYY